MLAIIGVFAATGATVAAETLHEYSVTVDRDLEVLTVQACFEAPTPTRLVTSDSGAFRFVRAAAMKSGNDEEPIRVDRRGMRLYSQTGDQPDDFCVNYSVDIARAVEDKSRSRRRSATTMDLLTSPGMWLWRPQELVTSTDIKIRFALPDGVAVSAPWQPLDDGTGEPGYRIGHTPYSWDAKVAIGRFRIAEVPVPGATLRVALLQGSPEPDLIDMRLWIGEAASAVATLYGHFPLPSPQVLVVPYGSGNGPVPWGQVERGGGAAVHFVINQRLPLDEFREDWTAVHEFSHLLLPYISRSDAWLSEGTASYYQNVLRARAGMIDHNLAWQKLYDGFQRGVRENGNQRMSLSEASATMYSRRAFMRVYWSGAAIALLADVELRTRTGSRQSMDTALAALRACCLPSERMWSATDLMATLDSLTKTTVFTELHREHINSRSFPDVDDTLAALGVTIRYDRVTLTDDAPLADLRKAIMSMRTE